jgi:hypothetical protein
MTIMSKQVPLALTPTDRMSLLNLTQHNGWQIFVSIIDHECKQATQDLVNADPTDEKVVLSLQARCRAINEFSKRILKQTAYQIDAAAAAQKSAA